MMTKFEILLANDRFDLATEVADLVNTFKYRANIHIQFVSGNAGLIAIAEYKDDAERI